MKKNKTFEEILNDNPLLYENTEMRNDDATQAIVYDWFRFRRVTSNNRFPLYFQRVINRDYTRYLQLLRIEAGKIGDTGRATNYDWLVMNYLESIETKEGKEDILSAKSQVSQLNPGSTKTIIENGAEKKVADGNTSNNGATSNVTNYDDTTEGIHDDHTNTATTAESRSGALAKATPMSAEYTNDDYTNTKKGFAKSSGSISNSGVIDHGRAISGFMDSSDSDYPSDNPSAIAGINKNFPDLKINNPSSVSDSLSTTGTINENTVVGKTHDHNEGYQNSASATKDTGSAHTDENNARSNVRTETWNGGDRTNIGVSGTEGKTYDDSIKHIHTGRNGETAEILTNVIKFINKSSACDWFRKQLETCFMQCFDEEED